VILIIRPANTLKIAHVALKQKVRHPGSKGHWRACLTPYEHTYVLHG